MFCVCVSVSFTPVFFGIFGMGWCFQHLSLLLPTCLCSHFGCFLVYVCHFGCFLVYVCLSVFLLVVADLFRAVLYCGWVLALDLVVAV